MHPILLKGHAGPISRIKYNRDGDLIFSCATKDKKPAVWYSDNGERLGTYNGHEGAVWDMDINFTSTRLLTASADRSARLWDVCTGKQLFAFEHKSSVRAVSFAEGDRMILTVAENNFNQQAAIHVYNVADDVADQAPEPVRVLKPSEDCGKIYRAMWGALNQTIIACGEDGYVRKWDVESGAEIAKVLVHKAGIRDMQYNKDRTMIITASRDSTAKITDVKTFEVMKSFVSDRPLNSAAISPLMNHVIMGGGQDAMNVTVTSSKVGHFEIDFHHLVYEEFMGSVKGHFGPVNSCAFCPDGKSFASGSEDGYVRLHHFEKDYFNPKYNY
jgi:translation initiation factor 3 subunit I